MSETSIQMNFLPLPEGVITKYPVREINRTEEIFLEIIAEKLDQEIENYDATVLEEIFHEEYNQVCYVFEFENLKSGVIHTLVIAPTYEIYAFSKQIPKSLIIEVQNCIADQLNTLLKIDLNKDVE